MFAEKELFERMYALQNKTVKTLVKNKYSVAIIDGHHFKNFTKNMKLPYDGILRNTMEQTMTELCKILDGTIIGYTQSDEIVLIFTEKNDGKYIFNGDVFKITSFLSSNTTLLFNNFFKKEVEEFEKSKSRKFKYVQKDLKVYKEKFDKATFNVDIFQIRQKDIQDCLVWKQNIAFRNSVQLLSQNYLSHSEIVGKNLKTIMRMLYDKGIKYDDYRDRYRYGLVCVRRAEYNKKYKTYSKPKWEIQTAPPFKKIPIFVENIIKNTKALKRKSKGAKECLAK